MLKPNYLLLSICAAATLILSSCDGSNGGPNAFAGEYAGVWDVRYNLSLDDCGIVEAGVFGFVDQHVIDQSGTAVTLDASSTFGVPLNGDVDAEQNFVADQNFSGDVFGDGTDCAVYQAISYDPVKDDEAESLYVRRISCNDGYVCESRALGQSTRR